MRVSFLSLVVSLLLSTPVLADTNGYDVLQGTWQLVSGVRDGTPLSDAEVRTTILLAKGQTYELPVSAAIGTSVKGTYTVDVSQTPFTVDSVPTDGPQAGQTFLGIWKLEGDLQTVAFAPPGKPRPTDFRADAGSGDILQVWRQLSVEVIDPSVAIYFGDALRAFNAHDAAAFAALFTADGDLIDPLGQQAAGREAIEKNMQHTFTSYLPGTKADVKVDHFRLSGDSALVDSTWTLSAAIAMPAKVHVFYVLQKQADGSWLAVAARAYPAPGEI